MKYITYDTETLEPTGISTEIPNIAFVYADDSIVSIEGITLIRDFAGIVRIALSNSEYNLILLQSAKQRIEKEVGCMLQLNMDMSNNITSIQRMVFRLFLHVTGDTLLTPEYITNYTTKIKTYLTNVDTNVIQEPIDVYPITTMQDLTDRKAQIANILNEEYYNKRRS
jgi:hypothetical protein